MRDLHKVKEQEGFVLTPPQLYTLLALLALALGLSFVLGFYLGRGTPAAVAQSEDPLVPPEVREESVAMLLARAAEEEATESEKAQLELQFHDILPARTGEGAEAPRPSLVEGADKPAAKPEATAGSAADSDAATSSTEVAVGDGDGGPGREPAKAAEATGLEKGGTPPPRAGTVAGEEAGRRDGREAKTEVKSEARESRSPGGPEPAKSGTDKSATAKGDKGEGAKSARPATPTAVAEKSDGRSREPAKEAKGAKEAKEAKGAKETKETRTPPPPSTEPRTVAKVSSTPTPKEKSPSKPESGAPAKPEKSSGKGYTVQVSSYQESGVADKLVRQLSAQGFVAYKVAAEVNGHTWYRVRVGSFDSREGAEREMQRLKAARSELNPMIAHR